VPHGAAIGGGELRRPTAPARDPRPRAATTGQADTGRRAVVAEPQAQRGPGRPDGPIPAPDPPPGDRASGAMGAGGPQRRSSRGSATTPSWPRMSTPTSTRSSFASSVRPFDRRSRKFSERQDPTCPARGGPNGGPAHL